jgi:hypothetical protein
MTTLRIHRVDNVDWGRYHSPWFKKFGEFLSQYFNVDWIDYSVNSSSSAKANLLNEVKHFGKNPAISDVDCIIENTANNEYVVLSFTEFFNSYVVHQISSPFCKSLLLAHFNYSSLFQWLKKDNLLDKISIIKPWFFGSFQEYDINTYRKIRESNLHKNGLFWKGLGTGIFPGHEVYRDTINYIGHDIISPNYVFNFETYMSELCIHKIALSFYMDLSKQHDAFNYPGEYCYRDMEYCSVGLPFLRIEYKDCLHDGLVANKHYLSINREETYSVFNKNGNKGVAELIRSKYFEYIEEKELLKYISDNQISWFDKNARWPNSAHLTLQLSGIDKWIS